MSSLTSRWSLSRSQYAGVAVLICALIGAAVRFWGIEPGPVVYDEAVHALYSARYVEQGAYEYTPWLHGPFLYYMSGLAFFLAEPSILVGRAATALVTLTGFAGLYHLREHLGFVGVAAAGLIIAAHPYAATFGSVYRQDAILTTMLLLGVGAVAAYDRRPTEARAVAVGALAGVAVATKEVVYLVLPPLIATVIAYYAIARLRDRSTGIGGVSPILGLSHLGFASFSGLLVVVFFYGGWPLTLSGVLEVPTQFVDAYQYWSSPVASQNGGGGLYYLWHVAHAPVLALGVVIGLAGLVQDRWSLPRWMAAVWFVVALVALSLFAKKGPRFVTNLAYPGALLVGFAVRDLARLDWSDLRSAIHRPTALRLSTAGFCVVGVVVLAAGGLAAPYPGQGHGAASPTNFAPADLPPGASGPAHDRAATLAKETGCPLYLIERGPQIDSGTTVLPPYPSNWHLRGTDYKTTTVSDLPVNGVVLTVEPRQALESGAYVRHDVGVYHVYAPQRAC